MKIIAIIQGALGDGLMTLFALEAVRRRLAPDAIDLWCTPGLGALAQGLGLADKVFSSQSRLFAGLYADKDCPELARLLSAYDAALVFSLSRDLFQRAAALSKRGVHVPLRPPPWERVHVLDHLLDVLSGEGLSNPGPWRQTSLARAFAMWKPPENEESRPLALHPGSGSRRKNHSPGLFLDLGAMAEKQGAPVRYILGPAEEGIKEKLLAAGVDSGKILEPPSPQALASLLLNARGYVGHDSGATHLASLLGLPVAALFGPSDPVRWRPVGPRVTVLRPALPCQPCFETQAANCKNPVCLEKPDGWPGACIVVFSGGDKPLPYSKLMK